MQDDPEAKSAASLLLFFFYSKFFQEYLNAYL